MSGQQAGSAETHGRHMASGALLIFAAEVAVFPLTIGISAFLGRALGPHDFGLYAVVRSLVSWLQMTFAGSLGRAAVKFVAESEAPGQAAGASGWSAVAAALIRVQLIVGVGLAALTFVAAPLVAGLMGSPDLATPLRLAAVGVPIFALAQGHDSALIGRGGYGPVALSIVVATVVWLVLAVVSVSRGLGVNGAILATIGSSITELGIYRVFIRPPLWGRVAFPMGRLARYAVPLTLDSLGRRLTDRVDLWVVQAAGGPAAAGYYGAAGNFTSPVSLIGGALSSPLLATLTRLWNGGQRDGARAVMGHVLRLALCLLPFAALGSGAATRIVVLIYGDAYLPAAPVLGWLAFAALAPLISNLGNAMLIALGRPGMAFAMTGWVLVPALPAMLILVPRVGAAGAAATAMVATWAGAAAIMVALRRWYGAGVQGLTLVRVGAVTAISYVVARLWDVPGAWVVPQLLVLSGGALLLLWASGELKQEDWSFARSLVRPGAGVEAVVDE